MVENIGNISQRYTALSAEVSPIKQFVEQKVAETRDQNQLLTDQVSANPYRYRDFMQISGFVPSDNGNCNCGTCERCLGKDKEKHNSGKSDLSENKSSKLNSEKEKSPQDQEEIKRLKNRDQEVRTHEQAHVSAGAKNAQYEYETGPDGKKYATGGNAEIDASKGDTPQASISKAQKIKRAALAPANPSSQDRTVAAEADAIEVEAKRELAESSSNRTKKDKSRAEETSSGTETGKQETSNRAESENTNDDNSSTVNQFENQFPEQDLSTINKFKDATKSYSKLSSENDLIKHKTGVTLDISA